MGISKHKHELKESKKYHDLNWFKKRRDRSKRR